MPKANFKTTISLLRKACGKSQTDMAGLLGRTVHTVASLESGKHPLTEELAVIASRKTGCSARWLLEADISKPIIDSYGRAFDHAAFKKIEGNRMKMKTIPEDKLANIVAHHSRGALPLALAVHRLVADAARLHKDPDLMAWKINKMLNELATESGIPRPPKPPRITADLERVMIDAWN